LNTDAFKVLEMLNNTPNPVSKKDLNFVVEHAHPKTHYTLMNMRELGLIKKGKTRGFYEITEYGRNYLRLLRDKIIIAKVV
jgi:DNA-binding PadR family transcriptional regulator